MPPQSSELRAAQAARTRRASMSRNPKSDPKDA